jgi:hypothetical protein
MKVDVTLLLLLLLLPQGAVRTHAFIHLRRLVRCVVPFTP